MALENFANGIDMEAHGLLASEGVQHLGVLAGQAAVVAGVGLLCFAAARGVWRSMTSDR